MIPKTIHYCWFGRGEKPELAIKCIESWQKFFPDYKIIEWNEDNFDVNMIKYTCEAYSAKKYAFVSDYARFWILYNYGGLYFDTDVEIIRPMDDIIQRGSYMGVEMFNSERVPLVAPGLGLAIEPRNHLYKQILDYYKTLEFITPEGKLNETTIVTYTTNILISHGLEAIPEIQKLEDVYIYPPDFFNPLDSITGKVRITDNTRSIHWYMNSWSDRPMILQKISRLSHRIFGISLHRLKKKIKFIIKSIF